MFMVEGTHERHERVVLAHSKTLRIGAHRILQNDGLDAHCLDAPSSSPSSGLPTSCWADPQSRTPILGTELRSESEPSYL